MSPASDGAPLVRRLHRHTSFQKAPGRMDCRSIHAQKEARDAAREVAEEVEPVVRSARVISFRPELSSPT